MRQPLPLESEDAYDEIVQSVQVAIEKTFMTVSEPFLKTQQVASALGVSVSTVKRWVDAGRLDASRTIGKHRLVRLADARRLAGELKLGLTGLDALEHPARPAARPEIVIESANPSAVAAIDEAAREALFDALRIGDTRAARQIVRRAWDAGAGAAALGDDLIRPVLERVGHGWMVGTLDIYQEHEATQVIASTLSEINDEIARRPSGFAPLAFGAAPEGDPYVLAGLLGELVLREIGWNVRNLGVNLPLRSIARAVEQHHTALVFVTVNYLADPDRFTRDFEHLARAAARTHTSVVVGGRALSPDIRGRMKGAVFGERLKGFAEFATRLIPNQN